MARISSTGAATFTRQGIGRGARGLLPLGPFVCLLGVSFGVAAQQHGLVPWAALLMSGGVFAGASQFVALGLWAPPLPFAQLWLATLAVNARHILMGAALHPWFGLLPVRQQFGAVCLLSDANWAWAQQAHRRGESDAGTLLGGGLLMWATWLAGTAFGVYLGRAIVHPGHLALDVLLIVFFATVLVDTWQGPDDLLPWAAAGAVSLLVLRLFPHQNWHVLSGALSGAIVGALRDMASERPKSMKWRK